MWDSVEDNLNRNPAHRLPENILKLLLVRVFLALDYLHTECQLVHTDIKGENILMEIRDNNILEAFVKDEMETPSARKSINIANIYASRTFGRPKRVERAIRGDCGSAVRGDKLRTHVAQPNIYRAPEVMLKAEWKYLVDIWNVGCMVWDLFEDKHLFSGRG
ncbi:kinase-like protein [Lentithecium fluviatile CBS 122367]|uniref:Kinase-like protein n=1 Tax=Lentithecium fluviatile CBS 122367 TaxID=1168545 RepID=A0A6G1IVR6_9PLEO|nr:kinase-like protein [Lentithecium fluviatile CBS 122367]